MRTINNRKTGETLVEISHDRNPLPFDTFLNRDLRDAVFDGLVLEGATFDDTCDLAHASFRNTDLYWGRFFLANLEGADFEGADLRGADMERCVLRGANLRRANLGRGALGPQASGANLDEADLRGADLTYANLDGASFRNAKYDVNTRFPENFDPTQHEMILVGSAA
jgi:uncharacterized protein YjbI with pentapeptide repeats